MNRKGYTLIEVLAVIVLLTVIATITVTIVIKLINDAKEKAFKDSVYAAIESYRNKEGKEHFFDLGEVEVTTLPLDNNPFVSGTIKRDDNNEVIVINVTNIAFCANGSKRQLTVTEGDCQ